MVLHKTIVNRQAEQLRLGAKNLPAAQSPFDSCSRSPRYSLILALEMASPPNPDSKPAVAQGSNATVHPLENGVQHQHTASNSEQAPAVKGKAKDANSTENKKKTPEGSKDGKPSGKELKEKSKAEKVARRAQQKQAQQGQPVVDLGPEKQGDKDARKQSLAGTDSNFPKTQHKRTGSTSTGGQKPMPFRPAQAHAPPIKEELKKENKNVALFDHLYGNPRRTTVTGASRDVHPAVLTLGLQIRNYVICGSSARCVATLLAFKRVSIAPNGLNYHLSFSGYRIIHNASTNFATSPSDHPPFFSNRLPCILSTAFNIHGQCNTVVESEDIRG